MEGSEFLPVLVKVDLAEDVHDPDSRRAVTTPDPFFVQAGHPLIFHSEYPFTVHFGSESPLSGPLAPLNDRWVAIAREFESALGPYRLGQVVRSDAGRIRSYKFTIAVAVPGAEGTEVFITDPHGVAETDPPPSRLE